MRHFQVDAWTQLATCQWGDANLPESSASSPSPFAGSGRLTLREWAAATPPTWTEIWISAPFASVFVRHAGAAWISTLWLLKFLSLSLSPKVVEVTGEGHGGRNSTGLQRRAGGLGELHLYADQRPVDSAHSLGQPHSDAYVLRLFLACTGRAFAADALQMSFSCHVSARGSRQDHWDAGLELVAAFNCRYSEVRENYQSVTYVDGLNKKAPDNKQFRFKMYFSPKLIPKRLNFVSVSSWLQLETINASHVHSVSTPGLLPFAALPRVIWAGTGFLSSKLIKYTTCQLGKRKNALVTLHVQHAMEL